MLFAAGKVALRVLERLVKVVRCKEGVHSQRAHHRLDAPLEFRAIERDVLEEGFVKEERILKDDADLIIKRGPQPPDVRSVDGNAALILRFKTGEQLEERALAAAVFAQNEIFLPRLKAVIDMGEDDLFFVPEGNVAQLDALDGRGLHRGGTALGDGEEAVDLPADAFHALHLRKLIGNAVRRDDEHFGQLQRADQRADGQAPPGDLINAEADHHRLACVGEQADDHVDADLRLGLGKFRLGGALVVALQRR